MVTGARAAVDTVVETMSGPVQGVWNSASEVYSFRGIPYAKAPTGKLRFADPEPTDKWLSPINVSEFGAGCVGWNPSNTFVKPSIMVPHTTSEDCLFLNVFTQSIKTAHTQKADSAPVIVFIHGGAFSGGAGGVPMYDGQYLAGPHDDNHQKAVVVTLNYRLGPFGTLFTGVNKGANYNIKDQRLALKWVQNNIANFGGDPKKVTIVGQSAGAFSVAIHLASKNSWPYFHRAMMMSSTWSLPALSTETAVKLSAKVLDGLCPTDGSIAELECLQQDSDEFVTQLQANSETVKFEGKFLTLKEGLQIPTGPDLAADAMPWVPVLTVEEGELNEQPITAFEKGNIADVPIITGTVGNETLTMCLVANSASGIPWYEYYPMLTLVFGFRNMCYNIDATYGKLPFDVYIEKPDGSKPNSTVSFLSPILTDYIFYCANRRIAETKPNRKNPIHVYFYNTAPSTNQWIYNESATPECVTEVCHASDLQILFNAWKYGRSSCPYCNMTLPEFTAAELKFVNQYQSYVKEFAASGKVSSTWPSYAEGGTILNMTDGFSVMSNYRDDVCKMWDRVSYTLLAN